MQGRRALGGEGAGTGSSFGRTGLFYRAGCVVAGWSSREVYCGAENPSGGFLAAMASVAGVRQLTTKYCAGSGPTLRRLCEDSELLRMTEPGPRRFHWPLERVSTVP